MQTHSVADKASLSGLRRSIRADLAHAGVDPSAAFDCLVAVTEACTQALVHCDGEGDEPAVSWTLHPGSVRFDVRETACTRAVSKATHPSGRSPLAPTAVEDEGHLHVDLILGRARGSVSSHARNRSGRPRF